MRYIKPLITLVLTAALAFWIYSTLKHNKQEIEANAKIEELVISELPVRVSPVQRLSIDKNLELNGTFAARKELDIIAEAQGRITNLYIREGQRISRGQTIAKIDATNVIAQLNSAQAAVDKAAKDVERYERLLNAGAISRQQYEEVLLNHQNLQSNVTGIEQQLNYSTAHSPMAGIVKVVNVEEGSFATPGSLLATVVDISQMKMVVKIDETELRNVSIGQKVIIKTDVYPDLQLSGRVALIGIQADAGRKYDVEIELPNPAQTPLRPGMYGTVSIQSNDQTAEEFGLFVPRKAIVGSVQDPFLFIALADGTVTSRRVEVGETADGLVLIRSGLQADDIVVTSGQINLSDGRRVRIIEELNTTSARVEENSSTPAVQ